MGEHGRVPRIGCAGWALSKEVQPAFPSQGTHLQRYASVFDCVEINSSFYRPHKPDTYRRWAASVPDPFRFSAKMPREITHVLRLRGSIPPLERFLSEVACLGDRLGPLLIQLPPSGAFDPRIARAFLVDFRARFDGLSALEPRHPSWFGKDADELLAEFRIARAAADPAVIPAAAEPGGWKELAYHRLHGSPEMYRSPYPQPALRAMGEALALESLEGEAWCIFDNTAEGHAIPDARSLQGMRVSGSQPA